MTFDSERENKKTLKDALWNALTGHDPPHKCPKCGHRFVEEEV